MGKDSNSSLFGICSVAETHARWFSARNDLAISSYRLLKPLRLILIWWMIIRVLQPAIIQCINLFNSTRYCEWSLGFCNQHQSCWNLSIGIRCYERSLGFCNLTDGWKRWGSTTKGGSGADMQMSVKRDQSFRGLFHLSLLSGNSWRHWFEKRNAALIEQQMKPLFSLSFQ